jgi:hypothetical protein
MVAFYAEDTRKRKSIPWLHFMQAYDGKGTHGKRIDEKPFLKVPLPTPRLFARRKNKLTRRL